MCKVWLVTFLLISVSARADVQLRSLQNVDSITIDREQIKNSVFIIFQPNCAACKKQLTNLDCLDSRTTIRLLGAFASEQTLRSEYRKIAARWPGYFADKQVLRQFSVTAKLAPQTLVFTSAKVTRFLGFTECDEIKRATDSNGGTNDG